MASPTHYETLGVSESSSTSDVRSAYLALARRLHPDRWVDASPAERADAERRMQAVNEAWRVLGNPGRRIAYEAERRRVAGAARTAPAAAADDFVTGDLFVDGVAPDGLSRVVRVLPWILLAFVLGGIFVFTAYATSDSGNRPDGGVCIVRTGGRADPAPCSVDGARTVVTEVVEVGLCPAGTEPYQPSDRSAALCLLPDRPSAGAP